MIEPRPHYAEGDTSQADAVDELDKWRFDDAAHFTLVITATVLGELDHLKIEHRNPELRERAESLIRRIKSYRGRGDLSAGVTLVKNVSTIKTLALEPKVEETLPWLDPTNKDDRILAAFVEVMREHVRTPVILVTRDINLQNKAEYAGLPFAEPSDPRTETHPVKARAPHGTARAAQTHGSTETSPPQKRASSPADLD